MLVIARGLLCTFTWMSYDIIYKGAFDGDA